MNTNPKTKMNIKGTILAIILALIIFSVGASAIIFACANTSSDLGSRKHFSAYNITANSRKNCSVTVSPECTVYVNICIEKGGYYTITASKNNDASRLPVVVIRDKDGNVAHHSDYHEDSSLMCLYLEKGDYEAEVFNPNISAELNLDFSVSSCDCLIEKLTATPAEDLTLGSCAEIRGGETKVFRLKNSKDSLFNYLVSQGKDLSVQLLDSNFENKGYDSTEVEKYGEIYCYIEMDSEGSDYFYGVFTNKSQEPATLHYVSETNIFYYVTDIITETTPVTLECQQEMELTDKKHFYHSSAYRFSPEVTALYDFSIAAEGECSSFLVISNADTGEAVVDLSSDFNDGSHCYEGITLDSDTVYSVCASASVTTENADNFAILTMKKAE